MQIHKMLVLQLYIWLLFIVFSTPGFAQEEPKPQGEVQPNAEAKADSKSSAEAQANNPLANLTAFNIQNYYIPSLSELDDQNANSFFLRYAQPFAKKWLMRASLPLKRVPTGVGETTSGMGDLNFNAFYLLDMSPGVSFGVGPQLTLDTATEDETGTGKYQAGVSIVYFDATSRFFQWGGLLTWQTDFAGDSDRADTNEMAIQPFYIFQLGKGLYLRGAPIWAFDLENNNYHVPIGLGIGQVVKRGKNVFNFFFEPQYTILSSGPGQPELQFYVALNMQFY